MNVQKKETLQALNNSAYPYLCKLESALHNLSQKDREVFALDLMMEIHKFTKDVNHETLQFRDEISNYLQESKWCIYELVHAAKLVVEIKKNRCLLNLDSSELEKKRQIQLLINMLKN